MKRKAVKWPAIVFFSLSFLFGCYFVANAIFSPYWNSVYAPTGYISLISMSSAESDDIVYTKAQAEEDLDYIVSCLERVHPDYKGGVSEIVKNQLSAEKSSFGDKVTSYEMWQSAARLMNSTGDANSIVTPSFEMHYLSDYLRKINNGYSLLSINSYSIDEIFEKHSNLFSYELKSWGVNSTINYFQTKEGLSFLGFDCSNLVFCYEDNQGNIITREYNNSDFVDYESAVLELSDIYSNQYYYFDFNEKNNFAMITIDRCVFETPFKEFLYNFFTEVNDKNITNVAVDLRNCMGGTSEVAEEFMLYMPGNSFDSPGGTWRLGPVLMDWKPQTQIIKHYDETQFEGNLYILTSSKTFSSAVFFADLIQANGFGKIVGEPCGSMPDCYDDPVVFQTPNSLLSFQISSKHYDRIDTSKSDQPLVPDVECPADEAVDKVLEIISYN